MISRKWTWVTSLLFSVTLVAAQDTCPTVVQDALDALDTQCQTTERNQACYGNLALTAVPQEGVTEFKFDAIGDIENLDEINTLDLAPLDPASGQWGLVMMRVQADIPDSLPGQNVTFILFGDVTIQNAARDDQLPMQAFYLTTGIGDANCADAPESGLMVQTPDGVKDVSFNVNGVDVQMGSTVIFQAQPGQEMNVKTIEGKALLKVGEETIPVVQGSEYTAPINENLQIVQPGEILPYVPEEVQFLPTEALERDIEIAPPLTEIQIEEVKTLESAGERLCSDAEGAFLPRCTRPLIDANGEEIKLDDTGAPILLDQEGKPLLYDETTGAPILTLEQYDIRVEEWTEARPKRVLVDDDSIIYPVIETPVASIVPIIVTIDPIKPREPITVTIVPIRPRETLVPIIVTLEPIKPLPIITIAPTKVPERDIPTDDPNKPREPIVTQAPPTEEPRREVPPTEDPNKPREPIEPTKEPPPTEDPNKPREPIKPTEPPPTEEFKRG